jgi:basic membrane lipoprotein Med (substrate-binding protein (PBP1-ABC) superfamily)
MSKNVLVEYSQEIKNTKAARSFLNKFINSKCEVWVADGGGHNTDLAEYVSDNDLRMTVVDLPENTLDLIDYVVLVTISGAQIPKVVKKAMSSNMFVAVGMIPK